MAALSTFAELMARASATVFSQLCTNALEKAQQQHQQQLLNIQQSQQAIAAFPMIPNLISSISNIQQTMPCTISPISQQHLIPLTSIKTTEISSNNNLNNENNNLNLNKINRKRKRSKNNELIKQEVEAVQSTQTQLLIQQEQQQQSSSNSSPPSGSRISSPDSTNTSIVHKGRKLKLYAAEEKTDIIDYAKCIGNRAAGREFNVAESSIREWRKNEDKIRKQAETTAGCTQYFEKNQNEILERIDNELVILLNSKDKRCNNWYGIAEQVNLLWENIAKELNLETNEMKITMGWVSRFMRRNEQRVPKVTPPIIATSSSTNNNNSTSSTNINSSAPSMVLRKNNVITSMPAIETRAKAKSKAASSNITKIKLINENIKEDNNNKNILNCTNNNESSSSRRKRFRPVRVDADCATLITSVIQQEQQKQNNI